MVLGTLAPQLDSDLWDGCRRHGALMGVDGYPEPDGPLNPWFMKIVRDGTGHEFQMRQDNDHWLDHPRRIIEAYLHTRHMLQMVVDSGTELDTAPSLLPYNWATVLELYGLR